MMSAFDATVHSINRRKWWSQYLAAVVLLIIFTLLLVVAVAMLTGGQILINYLDRIDIIRDKFFVLLVNCRKVDYYRYHILFCFLFFILYGACEKNKVAFYFCRRHTGNRFKHHRLYRK